MEVGKLEARKVILAHWISSLDGLSLNPSRSG